jgi:hypothetical protein
MTAISASKEASIISAEIVKTIDLFAKSITYENIKKIVESDKYTMNTKLDIIYEILSILKEQEYIGN